MSKHGWSGELSKFGRYLKVHKLEREAVAKGAEITPSYVSMLAHGKASPGFKLAARIEKWTSENVTGKDGQPKPFAMKEWV